MPTATPTPGPTPTIRGLPRPLAREEEGRIVLSPVRPDGADRVREKLQEMGLEAGDIEEAVRWARRR